MAETKLSMGAGFESWLNNDIRQYLDNKAKAELEYKVTGQWNDQLRKENDALRDKYGMKDDIYTYEEVSEQIRKIQGTSTSKKNTSSSESSTNPRTISSSGKDLSSVIIVAILALLFIRK